MLLWWLRRIFCRPFRRFRLWRWQRVVARKLMTDQQVLVARQGLVAMMRRASQECRFKVPAGFKVDAAQRACWRATRQMRLDHGQGHLDADLPSPGESGEAES